MTDYTHISIPKQEPLTHAEVRYQLKRQLEECKTHTKLVRKYGYYPSLDEDIQKHMTKWEKKNKENKLIGYK